jgi:cation-transporting ATPase I
VEINSVLGLVTVVHDPDLTSDDVVAAVVAAEREQGLHDDGQAPGSAIHPGNTGPLVRELLALGTNLAGVGWTVASEVLPVQKLVPPVVPAVVALVDSAPLLRAELQKVLGRQRTDTLLALGGALGQALSRKLISQVTDSAYRFCTQREVAARRLSWQRWEEENADRPGVHQVDPVESMPRPSPLPNGPVENVANTSALLALVGYAALLAVTRSPQRALGILLAGVPRAAKVGREAFAAQLATDLCNARALVFEPDALRRLDRVDTVVLDASALLIGRKAIDEVVAMDETAEAELLPRALALIDLHQPDKAKEDDGWSVAPLRGLAATLPGHLRQVAAEKARTGATVLVVLRDSVPVGLVTVVAETDPLTDALVRAARTAGRVLVAGVTSKLDQRLETDGAVRGGNRLMRSVRDLQADGHVVAVVSTTAHAALAAADVGIGVPGQPDNGQAGTVPWGAHVMCVDRAQACTLLEMVPAARRASLRSAQLAVAGSSAGALLSGFGPAHTAPDRASYPVQFAALLALAGGTWWGSETTRKSAPVPVDHTPWHAMSPPAVLSALTTSPEGLDEEESERRRARAPAGDDPTEIGLARAAAEELANPLTPALVSGAGLSASIGSIADALMISGVLGLNALIGGAQRMSANRELHKLVDTSALRIRLRKRDGGGRDALAEELVPGEVIELNAGDAVPADCRLLEAVGLEVDESSLTGESQLVPKTTGSTGATALADRTSMLYQGTVVAAGRAVCVVVATGESTELGRTTHLAGEAPPTTGVAARLQRLTKQALPVSIGAGAVLMLVDTVRGSGVNLALARAVSLSVAAVPEGLPFVATVAELASARRLSKRGVIARSPSTIETLGRVDVLCFDKTGTLTEGTITLERVSDGVEERPVSELTPALREVLTVAALASPWQESERVLPHFTDRAVLNAARELGVLPDDVEWVAELPFEPSRGYHAVLSRASGGAVVSVKGAPEAVLGACDRWSRPDPFDEHARRQIESTVDRLARNGFRVIAVAQRRVSGTVSKMDEADVRDLEFRGLLALADPVRPTAARAVDELRRAGVDVVMITGDHPSTAEAIAAVLNVLNGGRVMTGAEFDALDDDALLAVLPEVTVFARVSPEQKARIVRQLRRADRIVAMTGDGANDVPAIRLAHVGIALGTRATPAAREAADLVVTDDRIETITHAIVEGRAMWSSVRDALSILLGGNLGEIAFTVGAGLFSAGQALNARQLLLVNLLTDVLPAMAVAVRPPPHATPEQLLAEGPEASLGRSLTRDIYLRAAITASAAGAGWLLARPVSTAGQASTTALVTLVSAQLGQTVAVRGRTPLVIAAGLGSLVVLAAVVQTPGVSRLFGSRPLMPHQWGIAALVATAATVVELFRHIGGGAHDDFVTDSSSGNP